MGCREKRHHSLDRWAGVCACHTVAPTIDNAEHLFYWMMKKKMKMKKKNKIMTGMMAMVKGKAREKEKEISLVAETAAVFAAVFGKLFFSVIEIGIVVENVFESVPVIVSET